MHGDIVSVLIIYLIQWNFIQAGQVKARFRIFHNQQPFSSLSLSPLLVTQRHHTLQCHRECMTRDECAAFSETQTQCSLYDKTVDDTQLEPATGNHFYNIGRLNICHDQIFLQNLKDSMLSSFTPRH